MTSGEPRQRLRAILLATIAVAGLLLRLENARTMAVIGDERHIVEDALWSRSPLTSSERIHFLRHHQSDHKRLNPATGDLEEWKDADLDRWGHPTLVPMVAGSVFAIVPPELLGGGVRALRVMNAVADSATIVLLPTLVRVLGASAGAGLAAAALYAFLPATATFGAIANVDPVAAPLLVLLAILVGAPAPSPSRFAWAGLVTGLLAATKETGLVGAVMVPAASLFLHRRPWRGLLIWALAATAVGALLFAPLEYLARVVAPPIAGSGVELGRLAELGVKLRLLLDPSQHGWLGFARHGHPIAPFLARAHAVGNVAFVLAALGALAADVLRRRWSRVLLLWLPVLLAFALIPSDAGLPRRMHLVLPLVCASIVCELAELPALGRALALAILVAIGASTFLPQRPAQGRVDLADLIRTNPGLESAQPIGFYKPWEGQRLSLIVPEGFPIERALWLRSGRYRVHLDAQGLIDVELDGQKLEDRTVVKLDGTVHRLSIESPAGAVVQGLVLRRIGR